jgi:hypothetical protein
MSDWKWEYLASRPPRVRVEGSRTKIGPDPGLCIKEQVSHSHTRTMAETLWVGWKIQPQHSQNTRTTLARYPRLREKRSRTAASRIASVMRVSCERNLPHSRSKPAEILASASVRV